MLLRVDGTISHSHSHAPGQTPPCCTLICTDRSVCYSLNEEFRFFSFFFSSHNPTIHLLPLIKLYILIKGIITLSLCEYDVIVSCHPTLSHPLLLLLLSHTHTLLISNIRAFVSPAFFHCSCAVNPPICYVFH